MTEQHTPQYINPLILHRADPFIYKHTDGYYYFTASHTDAEHNLDGKYQYRKILIRRAASINDLSDAVGNYTERCVYEREPICGSRSPHVLCCESNPMTDEWTNLGPIKTSVTDSRAFTDFSLDHTVFEHHGELYMLWAQKVTQDSGIYIARMSDPATICTEMVLLTHPEYEWERYGFAVNEGPSIIKHGGKIFMVFSCSGTDARYCLGMMYIDENADVLDTSAWTKLSHPVFTTCRENGQFGPGHNSFTRSEDDRFDVMVYHSRMEEHYIGEPGYEPLYDAGRNTCVKTIEWNVLLKYSQCCKIALSKNIYGGK